MKKITNRLIIIFNNYKDQ